MPPPAPAAALADSKEPAATEASVDDRSEGEFHKRLLQARALLEQPRQRKEALALLEALRGDYPKHPEVYIGLGDLALDARKHEAAIARYKEALEVKPNYPPALFSLAKAFKAAGEAGQALSFYEAYVERRPRGPRADRARQEIARLRASDTAAAPPPF